MVTKMLTILYDTLPTYYTNLCPDVLQKVPLLCISYIELQSVVINVLYSNR